MRKYRVSKTMKTENEKRDDRLRALEFELKRLIERVEKLERKAQGL